MAKRRERAEALIDLAEKTYERTGERTYRADVALARAQVHLELGTPEDAERWLLETIEAANANGDLHKQLVASTQLARLAPRSGKLREAHDRLARLYALITEGFDRGPARDAKAALDGLAVRLDG